VAKPNTFVRIPKERVGALIGPKGETKRAIEKMLSVELQIESDTGGVTITLAENAEDPSVLLRAKDVVTAIGRGFSPEHAFRLIQDEETVLDIIDLRIIFGRSESDIRRVKGRIIGMEGKTRRIIEELTDTNITVYGHTVGIIGKIEQAQVAREAIQITPTRNGLGET
jgi:ribosomal RNA assembly protein